jgi:hypothetical protein
MADQDGGRGPAQFPRQVVGEVDTHHTSNAIGSE